MQRAVALRSGTRALSRDVNRASGRKRELQACRHENVPAPIEMRRKELGGMRRFCRRSRCRRRRHSRSGVRNKSRLTGECQHDDQCKTRGERP